MLEDEIFLYEISEVLLKRVPARPGYLDQIPHGDAAMVAGMVQNHDGPCRDHEKRFSLSIGWPWAWRIGVHHSLPAPIFAGG